MKILKVIILLFFCTTHFNITKAQKVSEYVKTNHYKYKCAYCGKTKTEDEVDVSSIKNPQIKKNATSYGLVSGILGSYESSDDKVCDISKTGKHRYELLSKTTTTELYTADKESTQKSPESKYNVGDKAEYDDYKSSNQFYNNRKRVAILSKMTWEKYIYSWGYVDKNDILKISFKYSLANDFSEGLAGVVEKDGNGKVGFIDVNGNVIIDFKYDNAYNSEYGIINAYIGDVLYKITNPIYAKIQEEKEAKRKSEEEERELKDKKRCEKTIEEAKEDITKKVEKRKKELIQILSEMNYSSQTKNLNYNAKSINYPEVKIGNQTWMSVNLNVKHFKNGESIPEAKCKEAWELACLNKEPIFCYYNFDSIQSTNFGIYYNYYAITDKRGIAPNGWHISTQTEMETLEKFLVKDEKSDYLNSFTAQILNKDSWKKVIELFQKDYKEKYEREPLLNPKSYYKYDLDRLKELKSFINSSGFSAFLSGTLRSSDFTFVNQDRNAEWWDSDGKKAEGIVTFNLTNAGKKENGLYFFYKKPVFKIKEIDCSWEIISKEIINLETFAGYGDGFPVRCVKDYQTLSNIDNSLKIENTETLSNIIGKWKLLGIEELNFNKEGVLLTKKREDNNDESYSVDFNRDGKAYLYSPDGRDTLDYRLITEKGIIKEILLEESELEKKSFTDVIETNWKVPILLNNKISIKVNIIWKKENTSTETVYTFSK